MFELKLNLTYIFAHTKIQGKSIPHSVKTFS